MQPIKPESQATAPDPSRTFLAGLLVVTFALNTVGRGVSETFAVFLLPVERGLAASRADMSLTYSIFMLGYAASAPFAGQLIDRLGARLAYCAGVAALGTGYFAAGSATALWQIYVCVGLLGGIGAATLGMVTASALLSRWFTQRLGSVMALPYAAVGAGMLVFPPAAQVLIETFGWRDAYRALGLATLALLPVLLVLPLGRYTAGASAWREARAGRAATGASLWGVASAARTGAFWALFAVYFATSFAAYAVVPHSVAYLVEQGFAPLAAAGAFGLTGMLSAVGIVAMGWLSDSLGRRATVTLSLVSTMLGVALLMSISVWPSPVPLYGFVIFFGLMQGARGPILVALIAKIFPGGSIGSIFGVLSMGLGLGAGLGSWVSGALQQATGGYLASFGLAIVSAFVAMLAFWVLPSLRQERVIDKIRSTR